MGAESVSVVNETSNLVPSRVLKPVVGNSIGRASGMTLGQMATSAAANDPVDWSARDAELAQQQASENESTASFNLVVDSELVPTNHPPASREIAPSPAGQYRGEAAGTVRAGAEELLAIDLALSDPLNAALIELLSPGSVTASSEFSQQLIQRYGEQRFAQMKHLQEAHERVRDLFRDALNRARFEPPSVPIPNYNVESAGRPPPVPVNTPPGWMLQTVDFYESGGEGGSLYRGTEYQWRFDSAQFTRWYSQQPGITHQVFGEMYGRGAIEILPGPSAAMQSEYGEAPAWVLLLDNGAWVFDLRAGYLRPSANISAVHSEETELHDSGAIRFDPQFGLSTASSNLNEGRDWFDGVFDLAAGAIIAYVSYQTGGAFAGAAEGFVGAAGSAGAAVAGGAAAGATGAALNGFTHENFDWKAVFRAALSGGLGAGISQIPFGDGNGTLAGLGYTELTSGGYTVDWGLRTGSMIGQASLRGLLSDALGGKFKDGAKQAALQFVAQEFTREFGEYLRVSQVSGADAVALKFLSQVTASAIRVAGNAGNPMQPIAQSWLEGLLHDVGAGAGAGAGAGTRAEVTTPTTVPVVQLATLSPVLGGRTVDVQPIDLRPVDIQPVETTAEPTESDRAIGPAAPTAAPSFAGELDAWNPSADDSQTEPPQEPTLLARAGRSDTGVGLRNAMVPIRELNGTPTPPLDPVTGLPVERVTTGPNMMPTNEWRPMPSQSEADIKTLIDKQSRENLELTPQEQGRLDAANWVRRERAQAAGASEGNGYVTDDRGNIRTFELDRSNQVLLKIGERVENIVSYRNSNGEIVYVKNINEVPSGIDSTNIAPGRALYYGDQLIARDFAAPQAFVNAVVADGARGGDPVNSLRRQVSVSPTGPYSELARFIDKGSGQVNPLDWEAFQKRALEIAGTSGERASMVVTSNGMLNTYQQANANAVGLANLIPNAIVVNVLNPSTGFRVLDAVDVVSTNLGVQQTVASAIAEQIREARGFQAEVARRISSPGSTIQPQNILLIAHSQGTVNANQAIERLGASNSRRISDVNAMYVGTAVRSVPVGLAQLSNVTDFGDLVSTNPIVDGANAIRNTFRSRSSEFGELQSPFTPASQITTQIPENYRQVTTNFNGETRDTSLPTGNNHSLYLYLARSDVQRELARLLDIGNLNRNNRPVIPTYTGEPENRTGG